MKTFTLIDTGGHGYLSVSKADIRKYGFDHTKISGFSGHDFNRVYLEEDCDATAFLSHLDAIGVKYTVKNGYNLKFRITHNYNAALFNVQPVIGTEIRLHNGVKAKFVRSDTKVVILTETGKRYRMPKTNPFNYIAG
jgi:hypothetical protein